MAVRKVLIDPSVIIGFLRKKERKVTTLWKALNADLCFISSITVFELYCGATDEVKKRDLEKLLPFFTVIDFNESIAEKSAAIFNDLKKQNMIIEFRDIFIAASAIDNNLELITHNKKHFKRIKQLIVK
jgi:predicted nucleic acid-binding protein